MLEHVVLIIVAQKHVQYLSNIYLSRQLQRIIEHKTIFSMK